MLGYVGNRSVCEMYVTGHKRPFVSSGVGIGLLYVMNRQRAK